MKKLRSIKIVSVTACIVILGSACIAKGTEVKGDLKESGLNKSGTLIVWESQSGGGVQIDTPTLIAIDPKTKMKIPITLTLVSNSTEQSTATLSYRAVLNTDDQKIDGMCRINITVPGRLESDLLLYRSKLEFDQAVKMDVTVENRFRVVGKTATRMILPERNGYLRSYPLAPEGQKAGRFELGAQAASGQPSAKLGMPVVGLAFGKGDDRSDDARLAVSIDPYCGGILQASPGKEDTLVTVSTTYIGGTVPLTTEERSVALEFHRSGDDGMLRSFYQTIPEIKPGAAWIHDIHLVYFDYLSDGGEGWYKGLNYLADRIPQEHRGRVAVCMHGWYDYFQQYAYDHKTGKLLDSWIAFPSTRKIPMSIEEMHKRMKFAKDLGFRMLLYFADGTNSDSGAPDFHPEYVLRNKEGEATKGWKGPDSLGTPLRMDPSVPGLRDWHKGYIKALLDEYAESIDGLVWDETFYIPDNTISYTQQVPAYADRAMMSLVSDLTQIVQQYHTQNPDLVFLTSDAGSTSYALAAHGTWQDSAMRKKTWGPSMFANYRNSLWSCNWYPLAEDSERHPPDRNKYAATVLGLPQSLSNGYGHDAGPHEMPAKELDDVIQRFLKNAADNRQRTRYFVPSEK